MSTADSMSLGFVTIYTEFLEEPSHIRYDQFVRRLFKVDTYNEMLHHAKGGVCEEAGELSDAIKRHLTYGKPLDSIDKDGQAIRTKIIEELGDVRFYIQAVQNILGISEQEILQHNANKLSTRYAQLTYTNEAAISRADKAGKEEV